MISMKKMVLMFALIFVLSLAFTSCRNNKKVDSAEEVLENAGEAIEDAADDAAKATEEVLEDAGKAIESAVDAIGDAVKKAGKAIDKKIDDVRKD